jgi:hypothetical protein
MAAASRFVSFVSGLAGRTLALLSLLPGGRLGQLPAFPANGTRMCYSKHVALGIFPLLWSATRQTFVCLFPQLEAVQTSPQRLMGQTFLV